MGPSSPVARRSPLGYCEDCTEAQCVCEPNANWITRMMRAGRGEVRFGVTENGNIGVWWFNLEGIECSAFGDTAEEAISDARAL